MNLYLIRHGQARASHESAERPLSAAGEKQVDDLARFLRGKSAIFVSEIRHSTKLRSRQTAERLKSGLGIEAPLKQVPYLEPDGDAEKVARLLASEENSLMLVGHLPFLNHLVSGLVFGSSALEKFNFTEASVLCLSRQTDGGGFSRSDSTWNVEWMLRPELAT